MHKIHQMHTWKSGLEKKLKMHRMRFKKTEIEEIIYLEFIKYAKCTLKKIGLGKQFKIRKIPSEKCMKNLICIKCVSYHRFTLEKNWVT